MNDACHRWHLSGGDCILGHYRRLNPILKGDSVMQKTAFGVFALALLMGGNLAAQDRAHYLADFPPEEFMDRRAKVLESIGKNSVAVIQGAEGVDGFRVFRQTNTFYYLSGLETPHSYLLLDGRSGRASLYLPHRDEGRERNEGKTLSAEDADLIKQINGVDAVYGVEFLAPHLARYLIRPPWPALYTPLSPAERGTDSRDELLRHQGGIASDPFDGRSSREAHFSDLLQQQFPQFEIHDLSPILDDLRSVKTPREIDLIRTASQIAGYGIMEAMRSTMPGVKEYQLDAAARFVFQINGARREAYNSITAGGQNAWMGHYFRNDDVLKDGDLVLMDYAPDYNYYTSDVTRMWPVNGTYTRGQRELCEFILAYRNALLKRIRPGVLANDILDEASTEMAGYLNNRPLSKPEYQKAAEAALKFRGHLSHPVGMAVHDVGSYRNGPLKVGYVFSIDPMLWVPEEKLYVRMEDVVTVTSDGVENFTQFLPSTPEEIMAVIKERGVLDYRPPQR